RGQADHEADSKGPVQASLSVRGPPHLRQVVADPVNGQATFQVPECCVYLRGALLVADPVWRTVRIRLAGHSQALATIATFQTPPPQRRAATPRGRGTRGCAPAPASSTPRLTPPRSGR